MPRKIIVGFDGSASSGRALDFAIERARAQGDEILIVHVLEWSPYSFLTKEEVAERHRRRNDELQRANDAIIAPVLGRIQAAGVTAHSQLQYGHVAETLCRIAESEDTAMIMIGRTGDSGFAKRFFGSVAATLAQVAPVPVTIVP